MRITSKKLLSTIMVAMVFGNAWGDDATTNTATTDDRLATLEQHMQSMTKIKPDLTADNVFFIEGEYLLWHTYEDGLAYAVEINPNTDRGDVQNLDFEWDSGFRVALGYRMPHDKWELDANWTWFSTDADGSTTTSNQLIYPEWATEVAPNNFLNVFVTKASADWDLELNVLDGEIARYFMVTDYVSFKPHMGIRGLWVNQSYSTDVIGGINGQIDVKETLVKANSLCRGAGFRAGLDTEWSFCKHWSLFGNVGGSLVFATFNLDQKEYQSTISPNQPTLALQFDVEDQIQQLVATADLAMGISWDYSFSDMAALRLQLGWEFNDFFDQNKFKHFLPANNSQFSFVENHEDLTMQGLVFSVRVDF
ncbi:MAG: hypothetical protein HY860_00645 [Chlamydiales bacterium]|nr:hypothetical protein [Chlamydiales bacterium]